MLRKIQEYKLKGLPVETVHMPLGAEILTAIEVNGEAVVFAIVDPDEPTAFGCTIYRIATGKSVDRAMLSKDHIGSFVVAGYMGVAHFFVDKSGHQARSFRAIEDAEMLSTPAQPHMPLPVDPPEVPKDKFVLTTLVEKTGKVGPPEYPFKR